MQKAIEMVERGFVPDVVTRWGIRRLLQKRIRDDVGTSLATQEEALQAFVAQMRRSPLAIATKEANAQHYEVPTAFYQLCLGPRLKYSSCYFPSPDASLQTAEEAMLRLSCERAEIQDGMEILDLGCGWGSLTLWLAEHYKDLKILSVSNSKTQGAHILETAKKRGLAGIEVQTADINHLSLDRRFDRVVSIEMFEHLRNYQDLFQRIAGWLKDDGKLFFHIFCHATTPYLFENEGDDDWMARHFFSGGIMPSLHLPMFFQNDLKVERHHHVSGQHYALTAKAWLENLDQNRDEALRLFAGNNCPEKPEIMVNRWRIFFLSCMELFAFRGGEEWGVGHYLFRKQGQ